MSQQQSRLIPGSYPTKMGGYLVPLDNAAKMSLQSDLPNLATTLKVASGSVLAFKQHLPRHLILTNNAQVTLGSNATIDNCIIDHANVNLNYGTIENSVIQDSEIIAKTPAINRINHYFITNSELLDHLLLNAKQLTACDHVYARDLTLSNSAIDGGVYQHARLNHSSIVEPGSILFLDSKLTNTALVNTKETDKAWLALTQTPTHFVDHSNLKNTFLFHDDKNPCCLETCALEQAIINQGIVGEYTKIKGPRAANARIIVNGLDANQNKLDFSHSKTSILVAKHHIWPFNSTGTVHLPKGEDYDQTDLDVESHFKRATLSTNLLVKMMRFIKEPNTARANQSLLMLHHTKQEEHTLQALLQADLKQKHPDDPFIDLS